MKLSASRAAKLEGTVSVPGDKSVSHRALILGALAAGTTNIRGLLEGDDVLCTKDALAAMGAKFTRTGEGAWRAEGRGVGGLSEPTQVLDLGNSGTGTRLLMGVVAVHAFTSFFSGDASLNSRPMRRVSDPLRKMGAQIVARSGDRLPLAVIGTPEPVPISYTLPVPSAQVKSAILLAGLGAPGETTVIEPEPTRDHTERMLTRFGAKVRVTPEGKGRRITITGQPELVPGNIHVPGDPSSAAFVMVAALLVPGSDVRILGVGTNPLRTGLFDCLREMGADLTIENLREQEGEPLADLRVRGSSLRAIDVPPERAPSMIDEYPILAVAAAAAKGTTRMTGLAELKVKESDRLAAISRGLTACGVKFTEMADGLEIEGCNGQAPGGGLVDAKLDHRIAMAFLVLGLAAKAPVTVDGAETITTSFPGFTDLMGKLGAPIQTLG